MKDYLGNFPVLQRAKKVLSIHCNMDDEVKIFDSQNNFRRFLGLPTEIKQFLSTVPWPMKIYLATEVEWRFTEVSQVWGGFTGSKAMVRRELGTDHPYVLSSSRDSIYIMHNRVFIYYPPSPPKC